MNEVVATLTVGTRLRHDGEIFQVVDFAGRRITLQASGGHERQVEIGWLLGHPSTELLGAHVGQAPLPAVGPEFAALTQREQAALAERAAHVARSSAAIDPGVPTLLPRTSPGLSMIRRCR